MSYISNIYNVNNKQILMNNHNKYINNHEILVNFKQKKRKLIIIAFLQIIAFIFNKLQILYSQQLKQMQQGFEQIRQDNFYLKKALQTTRHQNDKLQQQISQLRFNYQELLDKNTTLNTLYNQFQKKNQLQLAQYNKDVATLTSQIDDLKNLIQQKQQQLQNFQIKIIPNLDQDMIRVKLITQMEGPYQQAVEKKQRQIQRLKEKLTETDRKLNILQVKFQNKQKQFKRQLEETKNFYQTENQKLLKQLNNALNRKEVKAYDKQLVKSQRKELEQLRYTVDIQSMNENDLRKQLMNTKIQKEKLLIELSQKNQKSALQLHLSSENVQLRNIKQEKKNIEQQMINKNGVIQKLQRKIKTLEKQFRSSQEEYKRNYHNHKQQFQQERQHLKQEIRKQKQISRKQRDFRQRFEEENYNLIQKLRQVEREVIIKKEETQKLKVLIIDLQNDVRQYEHAKKQKISLSKNLILQDTYERPKKNEQTAKKQNNEKHLNTEAQQKKIAQLQKIIAKLKQKLDIANKKIIDLLRQKAKYSKSDSNNVEINQSHYRQKAFSNIQINNVKPPKDKKAILLEYRDTSFAPLVPPTIYIPQRY